MWRRTTLVVAVVAAASFAAFVIRILVPPSEQPFYDMVAKMRAAGEAVDYDDLRGKDVPLEENGAADLLAACDWLDTNMPRENEWTAPGPWSVNSAADWRDHATPEQIEDLARLADRLGPFLELVEKAASKPHIQFADQPHDALGFANEHIPRLQRIFRAMSALMSGAREPSRRIDAIASVAALSRRIDAASSIDRFVACAYANGTVLQVRTALENGFLDPSVVRPRLDPFLREEWLAQTPRIVRSERVAFIQNYRAMIEGAIPRPSERWYERLLRRMSGRESQELDTGMAREVVSMCEELRAAEAISVGRYTEYARAMSQLKREGPVHVEADIVVPMAPAQFAKCDAARRLARIARAAAEFRAAHGDFPASLDELRPMFADGVPLDPFTDAAFVYEKTATRVRIASAGRLADVTPLDEATLRERCLVWELTR